MTELGYALSSEEHPPLDLVRYARQAEEAGFTFALISDHFHPWLDQQGNSPFVWSVIGGISQATQKLRLGTGVTCPTVRIYPAIIAQAAATSAAMLPGRFFLGVGSGENLSEHILGDHWPPVEIRHDMLTEAVEVIRLLFEGEEASYWGTYYTVENARLYTVPEQLPPVYVASAGPESAELAGRIGDGLISTAPDKEVVETFDKNSGGGKPHIGQVTVCWAASEKEGMQTAHKWWRSGAIPGQVSQELATPALFEQAARLVTEEQVAEEIICGPDAKKHLEAIQKMVDAGFEQVYIHQVGPDQGGFFDFYRTDILPEFR